MDRREFISATAVALLATPLDAEAQARKVHQIGVFDLEDQTSFEPFLAGLRERGWVDGQNIVIKRRSRLTQLIALEPDVILVSSAYVAKAATRETKTIPIVVAAADDLIAEGLIASLARPGGNVTGLQIFQVDCLAMLSCCFWASRQPVRGHAATSRSSASNRGMGRGAR